MDSDSDSVMKIAMSAVDPLTRELLIDIAIIFKTLTLAFVSLDSSSVCFDKQHV